MSMVQTISGSIPSAELGRTLSHEHLTNGTPGMERIPGLLDRAEMIDRCLEALRQAHDAGIDSIIDLTPFDLGRQVWLFEAVAERSPLNIVCATGVYRWVPVVYYGFYEGRSFRKADVAASSGCGAPPGASRAPLGEIEAAVHLDLNPGERAAAVRARDVAAPERIVEADRLRCA